MNGQDVYNPPRISHAEKCQAETFYKVMDKKQFTVPEISNILTHMSKMLLAHAEMVAENEQRKQKEGSHV